MTPKKPCKALLLLDFLSVKRFKNFEVPGTFLFNYFVGEEISNTLLYGFCMPKLARPPT